MAGWRTRYSIFLKKFKSLKFLKPGCHDRTLLTALHLLKKVLSAF